MGHNHGRLQIETSDIFLQYTEYNGHLLNHGIIPENATFVDAGACKGTFTDWLLSKGKFKTGHLIEPCKTLADQLRAKYSDNPNIHVHNVALVGSKQAAQSPEVTFREFVGLPGWGNVYDMRLDTKHHKLKEIISYKIPTMTIQQIAQQFGPVHYMKVAIEGAEEGVVRSITPEDSDRLLQWSISVVKGQHPPLIQIFRKLGYTACKYNGRFYPEIIAYKDPECDD